MNDDKLQDTSILPITPTESKLPQDLVNETPVVSSEDIEEVVTEIKEEVIPEEVKEEVIEVAPVVEEVKEETVLTETPVVSTPVVEEVREETVLTETPVASTPVVENPVIEVNQTDEVIVDEPTVEIAIMNDIPAVINGPKKPKKKTRPAVVISLLIFACIAIAVSLNLSSIYNYFVKKDIIDEYKVKDDEQLLIKKTNDDLDYFYDIECSGVVQDDTCMLENSNYPISMFKVPVVNIVGADSINEELKQLFNEQVANYSNLENKLNSISYSKHESKNIVGVVISMIDSRNNETYKVYNFSKVTGETVKFDEALKVTGISKETISEKVVNTSLDVYGLAKDYFPETYLEEEWEVKTSELTTTNEQTIKDKMEQNDVDFFISNSTLFVITKIEYPFNNEVERYITVQIN